MEKLGTHMCTQKSFLIEMGSGSTDLTYDPACSTTRCISRQKDRRSLTYNSSTLGQRENSRDSVEIAPGVSFTLFLS